MDDSFKPILLDLGCGKDKYQNPDFFVIGLDAWSKSDADIQASSFHLPFKDRSIHQIYARHFFEHFQYADLQSLLKECFRILKEEGRLEIIVPHYSCISAFLDPTHRTFFTKRTFSKLTHLGFQVKEIEFHWFRKPYTGKFPVLINLVNKIINRFQSLERFFVLIGGVYEIRCVMAKDKSMIDFAHIDGAKIEN